MSGAHAGRRDGRDLAVIDRLGRLHVAVVSDCLDRVGIRDHVMAPRIRPLFPSRTAGFALTVRTADVDRVPDDRAQWYSGVIAAVDSQQPGDVLVVSPCAGSCWGELLATASRARGARGVVADGFARDTRALEEMSYPTFVVGVNAQDSLGRVEFAEVGGAIACGGVEVARGDLVLADADGVVIVPSAVAGEVLALAEAKVASERTVREQLAAGVSVREVFAAHGVL